MAGRRRFLALCAAEVEVFDAALWLWGDLFVEEDVVVVCAAPAVLLTASSSPKGRSFRILAINIRTASLLLSLYTTLSGKFGC